MRQCVDCKQEFQPKTRSQVRCEPCINRDLAFNFRQVPEAASW